MDVVFIFYSKSLISSVFSLAAKPSEALRVHSSCLTPKQFAHTMVPCVLLKPQLMVALSSENINTPWFLM